MNLLEIFNATPPEQPRGGTISGYDLLMRPNLEMETLWKPFLPFGTLALLYGASDTGKSMFLRNLALAVVAGKQSFCGFELRPKHRAALYLATEDDDGLTATALRAAQYELDNIHDAKRLQFAFDADADIAAILTREPVDLVVIDAFTDVMQQGKLNDAQDVRRIVSYYAGIAKKHKCAVILLHHSSKRAEDLSPSKHNGVGSQSLQAKCRAAYEFRTDNDDPLLRHFCCTKGNFLPWEYKHQSFVLRFHEETLTFTEARNLNGTLTRKDFDALARPSEITGRPSKVTEIEAEEIFGKDTELTTAVILERAQRVYGASKTTMYRWITEALERQEIIKKGHGGYALNHVANTPKDSDKTKDDNYNEWLYEDDDGNGQLFEDDDDDDNMPIGLLE